MEYLTDKFKELEKNQLVSLRHIVGKQVAWTDRTWQPIIGFTGGTFIVFETESPEYDVFIAGKDEYNAVGYAIDVLKEKITYHLTRLEDGSN